MATRRWLTDRDNRLVYGVGITVLSLCSGLLIAVFHADVDLLIPLYAIGVFLSFTISQTGMVVRWRKVAKLQPGEEQPSYSPEGVLVTTLRHDPRWWLKLGINGFGAVMTAVVTVVFGFAKFTEGAWIVVLLVPTLVFVFFRIHYHYRSVHEQLVPDEALLSSYLTTPARKLMLLAINDFNLHTLPALRDLLQSGGPYTTRQAVHVDVNEHAAAELERRWREERLEERGVPLVILPSAFGGGDVVGDLVSYVRGILAADADVRVEVIIPEWSASGIWWRWLFARGLHHLTGTRLKLAFLSQSRVTVTNHRYVLADRPRARSAA